MTVALLFPGQGSQEVGMGKDFFDAFSIVRETVEEIEDALEQKISSLMFEGPVDQLNLTENTQPALMCVSVAIQRALEKEAGFGAQHDDVVALAGHSLGEYSALTAAGSFDVATTARLLKIRGQAMQSAVPVGKSGMAAILGLDLEALDKVLAPFQGEGNLCSMANDNCPGQVVISGHADAVEKAGAAAVEAGARKAVPLPVSAPFHCALMAPAAERMAEALAETALRKPVKPIVTNISAAYQDDPQVLKDSLVTQVTDSVQWTASMQTLLNKDVDTFVEIGAGKVLSGLMKRINREAKIHTVNTVAAFDAFLESRA